MPPGYLRQIVRRQTACFPFPLLRTLLRSVCFPCLCWRALFVLLQAPVLTWRILRLLRCLTEISGRLECVVSFFESQTNCQARILRCWLGERWWKTCTTSGWVRLRIRFQLLRFFLSILGDVRTFWYRFVSFWMCKYSFDLIRNFLSLPGCFAGFAFTPLVFVSRK